MEVDTRQPSAQTASRFRQYLLLMTCIFLQFVAGGTQRSLSIIYIRVIRDFSVPRREAVFIQGAFSFITCALGLVCPLCINRFDVGPCLMLGSAVGAIGFMVSCLTSDIWVLVITVGIMGGVGKSVLVFASVVVVSWTFEKRRKTFLVLINAGASVGQLILPVTSSVAMENIDLDWSFLLLGGLFVLGFLAGILFHTSREYFVREPCSEGNKCQMFDISLLEQKSMLAFLTATFVNKISAVANWFLADIAGDEGIGETTAFLLVGVMGFSSIVSKLIAFLAVQCTSEKLPVVVHWIYGCVVLAASNVLLVVGKSYWTITLGAVMFGGAYSFMQAVSSVIMLSVVGLDRFHYALGLLNVCLGVGSFVGNVVGGVLRDVTGSYNVSLFLSISLYTIEAMVIMGVVIRCYRNSNYTEEELPILSAQTPINEEERIQNGRN